MNIKRCPHCGGDVTLLSDWNWKCKAHFVYVQCDVCGARGKTCSCKDDPADGWNNAACDSAVGAWNMRFKEEGMAKSYASGKIYSKGWPRTGSLQFEMHNVEISDEPHLACGYVGMMFPPNRKKNGEIYKKDRTIRGDMLVYDGNEEKVICLTDCEIDTETALNARHEPVWFYYNERTTADNPYIDIIKRGRLDHWTGSNTTRTAQRM